MTEFPMGDHSERYPVEAILDLPQLSYADDLLTEILPTPVRTNPDSADKVRSEQTKKVTIQDEHGTTLLYATREFIGFSGDAAQLFTLHNDGETGLQCCLFRLNMLTGAFTVRHATEPFQVDGEVNINRLHLDSRAYDMEYKAGFLMPGPDDYDDFMENLEQMRRNSSR